MKPRIAKILLFLFLGATLVPPTVMRSVAQLPYLLEHFSEHRSASPDLTLLAFLELHYGQDFQKHQAAHDHSKLPLKSGAPSVVNMLLAPMNDVFAPFSLNPSPSSAKQRRVFKPSDAFFPSQMLSDIWQPPRTVA